MFFSSFSFLFRYLGGSWIGTFGFSSHGDSILWCATNLQPAISYSPPTAIAEYYTTNVRVRRCLSLLANPPANFFCTSTAIRGGCSQHLRFALSLQHGLPQPFLALSPVLFCRNIYTRVLHFSVHLLFLIWTPGNWSRPFFSWIRADSLVKGAALQTGGIYGLGAAIFLPRIPSSKKNMQRALRCHSTTYFFNHLPTVVHLRDTLDLFTLMVPPT